MLILLFSLSVNFYAMKKFILPLLALLILNLSTIHFIFGQCPLPSGLNALPAQNSASLSWNAVSGVSGYTVEVENTGSNTIAFNTEFNVVGTSTTVSGLIANAEYKFKVRSRCGGDHSDWSAWSNFVTTGSGTGTGTGTGGSCALPTGLAATGYGTSAALIWNAVSGVSSYTIEVEDASGNPTVFNFETNVTSNNYTVTGLLANQPYKFKVRSNCGGTQSDWTAFVTFNSSTGSGTGTGTGGSCAVPSGLSATGNGTSANLSWTAVNGVTSYTVEVEDASGNPTDFNIETNTSSNSYIVTGLIANQPYKFKVRSNCGGSQSDWSAFFNFNSSTGTGTGTGTGTDPNCSIPAGLAVSQMGDSMVQLIWRKTTANSYRVEIENASGNPTTLHREMMVSDTTTKINGLIPGRVYKFKVRQLCSATAQSAWSDWFVFSTASAGSTITGVLNGCGTPDSLKAAKNGTSYTLSWKGFAGAMGYILEIENASDNPANAFSRRDTVMNTSHTVTLTGSGTFKFKVKSRCSATENSDWSAWLFFGSNGTNSACAIPDGLTTQALKRTSAYLTWNDVAANHRYEVEVENSGTNNRKYKFKSKVSTNRVWVFGLRANSEYKFKVRSLCSTTVKSEYSAWVTFTTPATLTDDVIQFAPAPVNHAELYIFPNPAQSVVHVRIDRSGEQLHWNKVEIYDLYGRLVLQQVIEDFTQEMQLNVQALHSGLYQMVLRSNEAFRTQKLQITK